MNQHAIHILLCILCSALAAGCATFPDERRTDPETHTITGKLYIHGRPLSERTVANPSIWVRSAEHGGVPSAQVDYSDNRYRVTGLVPGEYSIGINVYANAKKTHLYPGNFHGYSSVSVSNEMPVVHDIHLAELIHLKQPQDNDRPISGWKGRSWSTMPAYESPVRFEWAHVGEQATYVYRIDRITTGRYVRLKRMLSGDTKRNWLSVDLPPSQEGAYYYIHIVAEKDDKVVGKLLVQDNKRTVRWDYPFRVRTVGDDETKPMADVNAGDTNEHYAFDRFVGTNESYAPQLSIHVNGQIGLSRGALRKFRLIEGEWFVVLFYDNDKNIMAIKPVVDSEEEGAIKLHVNRSTGKKGHEIASGYISARSFLLYNDIPFEGGKRVFIPKWNPNVGMIIVDLNEPHNVDREGELEAPETTN